MSRAQVQFLSVFTISSLLVAGCSTAPMFSESKSEIPFEAPRSTLEPPPARAGVPPSSARTEEMRSRLSDQEKFAEGAVSSVPTTRAHGGEVPAPVFSAETLAGERFDLRAQEGKVVMLDFWRQSCGPCLKAMSKVAELRRRYPENRLAILGINTDERLATALDYLGSHPHDWDQIHAPSQTVDLLGLYRVRLLPHFVVIDPAGNMSYRGADIDTAAAKVAELME